VVLLSAVLNNTELKMKNMWEKICQMLENLTTFGYVWLLTQFPWKLAASVMQVLRNS
jgi:hypothetical protein